MLVDPFQEATLDGLDAQCFGESIEEAPLCSAGLCIAVVLTLLPMQWAAQRPLSGGNGLTTEPAGPEDGCSCLVQGGQGIPASFRTAATRDQPARGSCTEER